MSDREYIDKIAEAYANGDYSVYWENDDYEVIYFQQFSPYEFLASGIDVPNYSVINKKTGRLEMGAASTQSVDNLISMLSAKGENAVSDEWQKIMGLTPDDSSKH